jgi:hypothetical protein
MFPGINLNVACSWSGTFGETKDGLVYVVKRKRVPTVISASAMEGPALPAAS